MAEEVTIIGAGAAVAVWWPSNTPSIKVLHTALRDSTPGVVPWVNRPASYPAPTTTTLPAAAACTPDGLHVDSATHGGAAMGSTVCHS